MFKKLRAKLSPKTGSGWPSREVPDEAAASDEFIAAMVSFENRCQPFLELTKPASAHAEAVAKTGKIDHALVGRLEDALTEIGSVEVQIDETRKAATGISLAAQARFETAVEKIADMRGAVEASLKEIRMAKLDFGSLRDDDDDDDYGDFDMD